MYVFTRIYYLIIKPVHFNHIVAKENEDIIGHRRIQYSIIFLKYIFKIYKLWMGSTRSQKYPPAELDYIFQTWCLPVTCVWPNNRFMNLGQK